jgi:hypothetical protein
VGHITVVSHAASGRSACRFNVFESYPRTATILAMAQLLLSLIDGKSAPNLHRTAGHDRGGTPARHPREPPGRPRHDR